MYIIVEKVIVQSRPKIYVLDACIVATVVGEKVHLNLKVTSNNEEIKPIALTIVKLFSVVGNS